MGAETESADLSFLPSSLSIVEEYRTVGGSGGLLQSFVEGGKREFLSFSSISDTKRKVKRSLFFRETTRLQYSRREGSLRLIASRQERHFCSAEKET